MIEFEKAQYSMNAIRCAYNALKEAIKIPKRKNEFFSVACEISRIVNDETLKQISPTNWQYVYNNYYLEKLRKASFDFKQYSYEELKRMLKDVANEFTYSFRSISEAIMKEEVINIDTL